MLIDRRLVAMLAFCDVNALLNCPRSRGVRPKDESPHAAGAA